MKQPRILLFVHDGIGLGHVRRLSRIACALQEDAACLVMCGHRATSWIVPGQCEYVQIPALENLLPGYASGPARPFVAMSRLEALRFRKQILEAVVEAFMPDAIVVDYLPVGKFNELAGIIGRYRAKKFFVMRGIMDTPENMRRQTLDGLGERMLAAHYTRILVASDPRICDVVVEYGLPPALARKTAYIGYVSEPVDDAAIRRARARRGVLAGRPWVVCSAGAGTFREHLVEECIRLTSKFDGACFDIVAGPRGAKIPGVNDPADDGRVRLHQESQDLALLHASADVVVCSGGYNSIVETLEGVAHLICAPVQQPPDPEQIIHADRLSRFFPLETVLQVTDLEGALGRALTAAAAGRRSKGREILNFDGAARAKEIILSALA